MALTLKKAKPSTAGQSDGYVNSKELADYPAVVIRADRFGERMITAGMNVGNYEDYVIGHFVALDTGGNIVLDKANAMWSIGRNRKGGPGVLFTAFDGAGVYAISVVKELGKFWGFTDVSDQLTESTLAAVETALLASEMPF